MGTFNILKGDAEGKTTVICASVDKGRLVCQAFCLSILEFSHYSLTSGINGTRPGTHTHTPGRDISSEFIKPLKVLPN